jgi:hypothetical protein
MTTLSVSVPEQLKKKMTAMDEINWSAVARKAFEEKVKQIEILKQIASKSKLTAKDAQDISNKINNSIARQFRDM